MSEENEYKVDLDTYSGPLDLLLYLIRREEVDLWNIPIARITEQYLKYIELMSELNINVAGEFIVMAATLIEIKSRLMTPEPEAMPEEEEEDPRLELVRQLMEYKRFKEAALALNDRAEARAERFARPGEKLPGAEKSKGMGDTDVSIWALFEAFSKLLQQTGQKGPHRLVLDTIPQEVIQANLEKKLAEAKRMTFFKVFEGEVTRVRLVGTFIALLELVKQQVLNVEQELSFGEIWINWIPPEERQVLVEEKPLEQPAEDAAAPATEEEAEDYDDLPDNASEIALPDVPEVDGAEVAANEEEEEEEGDEEDEDEEDEDEEDEDDEDEYEDDEEDEEEDDGEDDSSDKAPSSGAG